MKLFVEAKPNLSWEYEWELLCVPILCPSPWVKHQLQ